MTTSQQITIEMDEAKAHRAALRDFLSDIHGEILDDCGNWDAKVSVDHILDCAINEDWCGEGEFEELTNRAGIELYGDGMKTVRRIILSLDNVYED